MSSEKLYTNTGIARVINATRFSIQGLRSAFANEAAFRQELAFCVLLVPCALWLGETAVERALLIGSLFIVLIAEILNSALENVVDRVGTDRHELAGRAKDQGSAAVMLALLLVGVTWVLILLPKWFG
ncbi:MAG: diacylglycerol kinase [Pseudomonadota bacterium]